MFSNLLKSQLVPTKFPIVHAMILSDSSRTLTVTKESDQVYWIKMYHIETQLITFEERFEGQYIKLKEVE